MGVGWAHRHTSNRFAAGAHLLLHFSRQCPRTQPTPPWNRGSYRDGQDRACKKKKSLPRPNLLKLAFKVSQKHHQQVQSFTSTEQEREKESDEHSRVASAAAL